MTALLVFMGEHPILTIIGLVVLTCVVRAMVLAVRGTDSERF